jgi:hypothetical protein
MKYNIEDNIDFYSELLKIKNDFEPTETDLIDACEDICLITNNKLTDNHVSLLCGHKFNYIPLYHDIYNHKTKYNMKERNHDKLKYYEIRCPYCRKKQGQLLPYYPDIMPDKTHGVNYINPEYVMSYNNYSNNMLLSKYSKMNKKKCPPCPPSNDNAFLCVSILKYGVNKGTKCNKHVFKEEYCKRHYTINNKIINS